MSYGIELILDLYGCDPNTFNRKSIEEWLKQLCKLIKMEREDLHFWDYEGYPDEKENAPEHLAGTSAVQFITTSDIVIHTIDKLGECYINLFTCKKFDHYEAKAFTRNWFKANEVTDRFIIRGEFSKCSSDIQVSNCFECASQVKCSGPGWDKKPCFNGKAKAVTE